MAPKTFFNARRLELAVFAVLALVMIVTRSHSLSPSDHLPDTAWASFFVAGAYIRSVRGFVGLFLLGLAVDLVVIRVLGMPDYCFTAAYWLLIPAYGAMWMAGRWARKSLAPTLASLPKLLALVCGASLTAELISSGGFYAFSGHTAAPSLAGFAPVLVRYWPADLSATLMWTAVAVAIHIAVAASSAVTADNRR